MDKVKDIWNKLWEVQIFRYLFVGVINTLTSFCVFVALLQLPQILVDANLQKSILSVCAQFVGIIVSYILNSLITFKNKLTIRNFFAFAGPLVFIQFFGMGIGMYLFSLAGVNAYIAYIIMTMVNIVLGFALIKLSLKFFGSKEDA